MLQERTTSPQMSRTSDRVIEEVERLKHRLNSTYSSLAELRDRVTGQVPPSDSANAAGVETAFNLGGFVGGVGQSLEHAHRLLTDITTLIAEIESVI